VSQIAPDGRNWAANAPKKESPGRWPGKRERGVRVFASLSYFAECLLKPFRSSLLNQLRGDLRPEEFAQTTEDL
jgi:hypothetical protein